MFNYIKNMEARLSDDQKDMLSRIWEPTVVGTPLYDARRDLCVLPDGEIRSYGKLYESRHCAADGQIAYLSSRDCGLSWTPHYSHGRMNSCVYLEKPDIYITSCDTFNNNIGLGDGLWIFRSKIGPDDPHPEMIRLSDKRYTDSFLPCQSTFGDRIWFTTQYNSTATFFFSDDWGETWDKRELPPTPPFEITPPHQGLRWCRGSGTEPYAIELSPNKMMMLIRTPLDCFYQSFSADGGDTWSTPEPSTFYGTNTTAFLLRLSDGRVISFWNNTKPLPEPDHTTTRPAVSENVINGLAEDAFTNRDAAHAAISEDGGSTFLGYREILLNPARNRTDFRYVGGVRSSEDKSVHQFQAYELPYGKILVSVGQNQASRRLVIFDVNWLYENERREDFLGGLDGITTHTYVQSISGSYRGSVGNGHCAWNRAPSAYPMPDPDGGHGETLNIRAHRDDRLWSPIGGATWNFPASRTGRISVELKLIEKQARFTLTDRWYNTCDPFAATESPFSFELGETQIGNQFARIDIDYNTENGSGEVFVNGKPLFTLPMSHPCPTGLSYLVLQCATDGESQGFYVRLLEKK